MKLEFKKYMKKFILIFLLTWFKLRRYEVLDICLDLCFIFGI